MLLWTTIALAAPSPTLANACEEVVTIASFRDELEAVWARTVAEGGKDARQDALNSESRIACLEGPLDPADVAAFHRNRALASLAADDEVGAIAAASAARRLSTSATIEQWASASSAFADLVSQPVDEPAVEELQTSLAARIYTDGTQGATRYVGQPVVVQVFANDGRPLSGAWVAPRSPTPSWVTFPPPACEGAVSVDSVVGRAREAQQAFEDLEVERFVDGLEAVAKDLPCADRVVSAEAAAVIHRLEGVRLFIQGSSVASVRSFQEAQTLDPAFEPSEASVPAGSSLDRYWRRAGEAASPPWLPMNVPPELTLWVDGLETRRRPATLPSIVQVTAPNGKVVWTRFVPATVPLPSLQHLVVGDFDPLADLSPGMVFYKQAEAIETRLSRRRFVRYAGLASLVGSAGLVVANSSYSTSFNDPNLHPSKLQGRQRAVNATFAASTVLAVAGFGAVVWAEF